MTELNVSLPTLISIAALAVLVVGFVGAPFWAWTLIAALCCYVFQAPQWLWVALCAVAVVFNIKPLRTILVSSIVFRLMKLLHLIPQISETERTALAAGDVWVEGELFSGKPDFKKLLGEKFPTLSREEQSFIDGPVKNLCKMLNDWEISQNRDLPPPVWEYMKRERFFGMGIPKEYGGLQFSAYAHSEVLCILASRSLPACITVMVPNSLGPAELLNHYGTTEQKKHYLPRLACGEEIPCFALTEPGAGSDAGSISSNGVVFKGDDGKLYLRLNWNKRWITLAAVSTVLGLAFRLYDPENLLGRGKDLGITCALIPTKTPGVVATRRHDPLSVPFFNCPTQGHDVVVPIDAIIGGVEMAGRGWTMLMECLAAGRGISLPAQSTGGAKTVARVVSAHATVRKQFGVSIGKFEGIEEPLARIGSYVYMMDAARLYTLGALDRGHKPPVITAIMKYSMTELARKVINDGMDVQGGQAISRGPHNLLANMYTGTPIAITVEGANILTRTLIVFGQGALRAHPFAFKEVEAVEAGNLPAFDRAFWGHIGHVVRNLVRFVLLSLTRGRLARSPVSGPTARYWRKLAWASAAFAFMADFAMGTLAAKLKFREKITGRFADVLAHMYMATAVMQRFETEGRKKEDLPYLYCALDHCFHVISESFDAIYANLKLKPLRILHRFNPMSLPPSDRMGTHLAYSMQTYGDQRERVMGGVYLPESLGTNERPEQLARLEKAFRLALDSEAISAKIRHAVKTKKLIKKPMADLVRDAVSAGIVTPDEAKTLERAEVARNAVIQVDDFSLPEYKDHKLSATPSPTAKTMEMLA